MTPSPPLILFFLVFALGFLVSQAAQDDFKPIPAQHVARPLTDLGPIAKEIAKSKYEMCPATNVTGRDLPYVVAILPGQTCLTVMGDAR